MSKSETTEISRTSWRGTFAGARVGPVLFDVVTYRHVNPERPNLYDTYSVEVDGEHAFGGFAHHLHDNGLPDGITTRAIPTDRAVIINAQPLPTGAQLRHRTTDLDDGLSTVEWTDPRTFVYLVEGEPHIGTLDDYRRAYEVAHYSGMSISTRLWSLRVVDGLDGLTGPFPALESHDVRVEASRDESDDYRSLTFHCLDQVAHGRIDLRA